MASRTLDGPEENYLTIKEVAREIGMSTRSIRRLIARGVFPRPAQSSKGGGAGSKWSWRQVVYWNLRIEMLPFLIREKKMENPDAPNPAQPGHSDDQPGQSKRGANKAR